MEISLDNPCFQVDITDAEVHHSDSPKYSGSSSSGESARRSCNKCHGRMSSFSLDKHLFCIKCRGAECTLTSRCVDAMSSSLISKFSSMLAQLQLGLNPTSFSEDSAVPGYSACLRPFILPSAPRAAQAFGFGRAERTRCRMSQG